MRKLKSNSGVTMIELLIVAVIIGVVSSMAVPRFQIGMERMRLKTAAKDVNSIIRLARSYAVSDKQQYGVFIDIDNMMVVMYQDRNDPSANVFDESDSVFVLDTLPTEFTWADTDCENNVISFRPNGSANFVGGGNIYLMGQTEKVIAISQNNVLASTGRVQFQTYIY